MVSTKKKRELGELVSYLVPCSSARDLTKAVCYLALALSHRQVAVNTSLLTSKLELQTHYGQYLDSILPMLPSTTHRTTNLQRLGKGGFKAIHKLCLGLCAWELSCKHHQYRGDRNEPLASGRRTIEQKTRARLVPSHDPASILEGHIYGMKCPFQVHHGPDLSNFHTSEEGITVMESAGAVADGFKNAHRPCEISRSQSRLYLTSSPVEVGRMEVLEGHCGLAGDSGHMSEYGWGRRMRDDGMTG